MKKEWLVLIVLSLVLMVFQPAAACDKASIITAIGRDPIYRFGSNTKLNCVGTISTGTRQYLIAYYDWNETDQEAKVRGGFPHASHRVVVFDVAHHKLNYLGFYGVESIPLGISGTKIRFAHRHESGEIDFAKGCPPKKVLIDGEPLSFDK